MSFRRRMVLLAAGAVAAAIVIASVVVYVVTGNELRGQIDCQLAPEAHSRPAGRPCRSRTVNLSKGELAKLKREGRLPPSRAAADRLRRGRRCASCTPAGRDRRAADGRSRRAEDPGGNG